MNIDDIESDSETDSEVDSDEDSMLGAEKIKQLNGLMPEINYFPSEANPIVSSINHPPQQIPSVVRKSSKPTYSSAALAQIDLALSANKLLDEKMKRLERVLASRLHECREKLKVVQASEGIQNDRNENFRYISCGRPYFRDKQNFPAPDNDDAKMAKSQMYDFSLVISAPGWTVKDKSQLISMIHKMSIDIKKNELYAKIAALKRKKDFSKKAEREILSIRKEIDKVSKLPLSKVALPLDKEYDWDMLTNKLNRRHTAQEYQALWKLFFHPTINKNSWSNAEHHSLQKIAYRNLKQDWDTIALELNTGRTGYQCFVYFRTNMTNTFTGKKWTMEEITYLKRLIEYFKEDFYIPWGKIAAAMENRTKIQIYNKYLRLIEQRKGRFLPEEDAVILNCFETFGANFRKMTNFLPGRSMVQLRSRYQVLSKMRVSTVWTVEDDKKLVQLMANQDPSMNFSTATQYFPGRNRTKIRSRYVTLVKWMKKHPNLDLEHAPRRGARRLNHGQASDNLNNAVENLKNSLITTVQTRSKKNRITENSSHKELNDAIVVFNVNKQIKKMEAHVKKYPEYHLVLGPDHVVSLAELNTTNLRKNIIFFNAALDVTSYSNSTYIVDYPTLGDSCQDVSLIKMKSYSRRASYSSVSVTHTPNVWGKPKLYQGRRMLDTQGQRTFVLPPHLASIIAVKSIMALVMASGPYTENINLNVLCRRSMLLKEHLEQSLERFYLLFTWPLLLSNEVPTESTVTKEPRRDSVFVRPPTLPTAPAVTINVKCMKKFKNVDVTENIDLKEIDNEPNKELIEVAEKDKMDTSDEKIEKLLC